jgi:hypothetical protein
MSNLQIYTWIGVPALTVLIGIKILQEYLYYKAIIARFDRSDAWFNALESRPHGTRGKPGGPGIQ